MDCARTRKKLCLRFGVGKVAAPEPSLITLQSCTRSYTRRAGISSRLEAQNTQSSSKASRPTYTQATGTRGRRRSKQEARAVRHGILTATISYRRWRFSWRSGSRRYRCSMALHFRSGPSAPHGDAPSSEGQELNVSAVDVAAVPGPALDRLPKNVLLQVYYAAISQAVSCALPHRLCFVDKKFDLHSHHMLSQIWEQLDDPSSFVCANRCLRLFAADTHARAHWFLHRYSPYLVVFEAIARPKLFTD